MKFYQYSVRRSFKVFKTVEEATVAMLLKKNRNQYKVVRTKSGKYGLRLMSLK